MTSAGKLRGYDVNRSNKTRKYGHPSYLQHNLAQKLKLSSQSIVLLLPYLLELVSHPIKTGKIHSTVLTVFGIKNF